MPHLAKFATQSVPSPSSRGLGHRPFTAGNRGSNPLGDAIFAGIAQLVERNLAKVEVASSNLVSRSKSKIKNIEQRSMFLF